MKKFMLLVLGITIVSGHASAFECKAKLNDKELTLSYSKQDELMIINYNDQEFQIAAKETHDGHSDYDLITGDGVALTLSEIYGCITMVKLTSAIRLQGAPYRIGKINFGTCSGGSTPDSMCHPDNISN